MGLSVKEAAVFALAALPFAGDAAAQDYPVRMVPVSWPSVPAGLNKAQSLSVCTAGRDEWLTLAGGRVRITCTADDPHAIPTPFIPGDCQGDWTGAIAIGAGTVYPFYVHGGAPGCGYYHANLGSPGAWIQGGQFTHEFGHNLGLQHTAVLIGCGGADFDPEPHGPCSFAGYDLRYDVMGTGIGLNAFHRMRLNIPPTAIGLPRITQTIDLSVRPAHFERSGGLEYWVEYVPSLDQVVISYTGFIPFAADVVNLTKLGPFERWTDRAGGITIDRNGTSVQVAVVTPPTPTPTSVPQPTATPATGGCNSPIYPFPPIACTPTPTPEATWTPTPAASATPLATPPTTPDAPSTATPSSPTFTPTATTAPPGTSPTPTRPPTPVPGGCGSSNSLATLFAVSAVFAARQFRRPTKEVSS